MDSNPFKFVLGLLEDDNVFLTGGAGTGKSYVTRQVIAAYRGIGKNVVALGSTGVAAVNVGGTTLHSFFVLGISRNFDELRNLDRRNGKRLKELAKMLAKTDLLVIDEISMVSPALLEMVLYRLRSGDYRGKLLLVGDFFQLPPVEKGFGGNNGLFDAGVYAFECPAWEAMEPVAVELTAPKRASDETFVHLLAKVRRGICDSDVVEYLESLRANRHVVEKEPTTLFGRNREADMLNMKRLAMLPGDAYRLEAEITLHDKSIRPERYASWLNAIPIMEELYLKPGARVLFTTNKPGVFYNGERGVVVKIGTDTVTVEKRDRTVELERHEFGFSRQEPGAEGEPEEKPLVTVAQFPIRPAYAVTIHKSQGMGIDMLACNVDNIFADSQFYVGLSRATDPANLFLEFTGNHFHHYLGRAVRVSERVRRFYDATAVLRPEEKEY